MTSPHRIKVRIKIKQCRKNSAIVQGSPPCYGSKTVKQKGGLVLEKHSSGSTSGRIQIPHNQTKTRMKVIAEIYSYLYNNKNKELIV